MAIHDLTEQIRREKSGRTPIHRSSNACQIGCSRRWPLPIAFNIGHCYAHCMQNALAPRRLCRQAMAFWCGK